MANTFRYIAQLPNSSLRKKSSKVEEILYKYFLSQSANPSEDFHDEIFFVSSILSTPKDAVEIKRQTIDLPRNWRLKDGPPVAIPSGKIGTQEHRTQENWSTVSSGAPQTVDSKIKKLLGAKSWAEFASSIGESLEDEGLSSWFPPVQISENGIVSPTPSTPFFLGVLHFITWGSYMERLGRFLQMIESIKLPKHGSRIFPVEIDYMVLQAVKGAVSDENVKELSSSFYKKVWIDLIDIAFRENVTQAEIVYGEITALLNQVTSNRNLPGEHILNLEHNAEIFSDLEQLAKDVRLELSKQTR